MHRYVRTPDTESTIVPMEKSTYIQSFSITPGTGQHYFGVGWWDGKVYFGGPKHGRYHR